MEEGFMVKPVKPFDKVSSWVDWKNIIQNSKKVVHITNTGNNVHWITMIADLKLKVINVMDSLQRYGTTKSGALLNLLEDAAEFSGCSLDPVKWHITFERGEGYPIQHNGNDCGIYAILNMTASFRGMNRALWTEHDCQSVREEMKQKIVSFYDRQHKEKRKQSEMPELVQILQE